MNIKYFPEGKYGLSESIRDLSCNFCPDGFHMAIDIIRNGGIINLKSMHGLESTINTSDIVSKELTIRGASSGPFEKAIEMLDRGRIEVKRLLSKEFRLDFTTFSKLCCSGSSYQNPIWTQGRSF